MAHGCAKLNGVWQQNIAEASDDRTNEMVFRPWFFCSDYGRRSKPRERRFHDGKAAVAY